MEKEFVDIINTHQGLILKICRMYAAGAADAEDLYQEIVLQLWKAYPRFHHEAQLTTWMYRVALNTAISGFRKRSRSLICRELTADVYTLPSPASASLEAEWGRQLQTAIQALNRFDRSLMLLYLEERTYQEISDILGISVAHVGVKISRIKKKLKNLLNA